MAVAAVRADPVVNRTVLLELKALPPIHVTTFHQNLAFCLPRVIDYLVELVEILECIVESALLQPFQPAPKLVDRRPAVVQEIEDGRELLGRPADAPVPSLAHVTYPSLRMWPGIRCGDHAGPIEVVWHRNHGAGHSADQLSIVTATLAG